MLLLVTAAGDMFLAAEGLPSPLALVSVVIAALAAVPWMGLRKLASGA